MEMEKNGWVWVSLSQIPMQQQSNRPQCAKDGLAPSREGANPSLVEKLYLGPQEQASHGKENGGAHPVKFLNSFNPKWVKNYMPLQLGPAPENDGAHKCFLSFLSSQTNSFFENCH